MLGAPIWCAAAGRLRLGRLDVSLVCLEVGLVRLEVRLDKCVGGIHLVCSSRAPTICYMFCSDLLHVLR